LECHRVDTAETRHREMERGTFRRRIGEHELVRRSRLAATAPRHDVKGKFRRPAQVRLLFGPLA